MGRVPNLAHIKKEMASPRLYCNWDKDREGRLFLGVYLKDMYNREHCVCSFYNTSPQKARVIMGKVEHYSNVNENFLSQASRNVNTFVVKRIHADFDRMFPKVDLTPDSKESKKENVRK